MTEIDGRTRRWTHGGQTWTSDDVRGAQPARYAERPQVVAAGQGPYADLIVRLGLQVG